MIAMVVGNAEVSVTMHKDPECSVTIHNERMRSNVCFVSER
jgi:hypothetical protein